MIRILPPLVAVAIASMLAAPMPTRAAEPAPAPAPVFTFDPIARVLDVSRPTAILVGRAKTGIGYVLVSDRQAFWVSHTPNGLVRVEPVEPQKVRAMAREQGWAM